jgi:hypothetical protein
MSLPSGLIFFLDFTYEGTGSLLGIDGGDSLYGGGVIASQITGGVTDITEAGGGFYNLANAFSHASGSQALTDAAGSVVGDAGVENELFDITATWASALQGTPVAISALSEAQKRQLRFDPDLLGSTSTNEVYSVVAYISDTVMAQVNTEAMPMCNLTADDMSSLADGGGDVTVVRRLTHLGYHSDAVGTVSGKNNHITFYVTGGSSLDGAIVSADVTLHFPVADKFATSNAVGSVVGSTPWPLEEPAPGTGNSGDNTSKNDIPEIDIKVDSIAVTAMTKKLKAKWSPELGQDLNAYHNLDAEVELTQILSEQIALEIDREILNDLVQGATAGTYYWSRSPGLFVNRTTGVELGALSAAPDFTGTVSEWYETLVETINDVSAQIHRKTLRGGANFLVTSPEVANILEFTAGFRANVTHDTDKGTVGAVNVGSMSRKWDVFVDPYFPRNLVLVGRKGGSFLESGYVYAPYVPLQVTPTIFGTEDFVPRKGVMTRYAKKMVRPDLYGLVVVRGLLGEAGATS